VVGYRILEQLLRTAVLVKQVKQQLYTRYVIYKYSCCWCAAFLCLLTDEQCAWPLVDQHEALYRSMYRPLWRVLCSVLAGVLGQCAS
jgi:hypothetical protein